MTLDFAYPSTEDSHPIASPDARLGLLVIGDRIDLDDVSPIADAAGLRLLGVTGLDQASTRLDDQTRCDTLLIFCPVGGTMLERLLVQVETQAIQTGMAVIVVAGWDTMDLAYACIRSPYTQLLCDPDRTELAAALVASADRRPQHSLVHDINGESARLQRLSEEVGRLARTIDALSQRPHGAAPSFDLGPRISDRPSDYIGMPSAMTDADLPYARKADGKDTHRPVTAAQIRDLLRARRLRGDFMPGDLFADPAWDMLLDLLAAHLDQGRVSVSSLCIAAAVPPTTALRHIRTLTDRGLVERQADPHDGRRVFIALTQDTAESLIRWFGASRRLMCS